MFLGSGASIAAAAIAQFVLGTAWSGRNWAPQE
jgi:hypothetical protein